MGYVTGFISTILQQFDPMLSPETLQVRFTQCGMQISQRHLLVLSCRCDPGDDEHSCEAALGE